MKIVKGLSELRSVRAQLAGPVAFVPTMGALHTGHGSVMTAASESGAHLVVSIFVNPTQFDNPVDFSGYPQTVEADIDLCRQHGVDVLWFPQKEEMYPESEQTFVQVGKLADRWEGASRPGHFQGVATVVTKLLLAVQPDNAYFGRKDLQQLFVVKALVNDLLFPIEVVGVATARESNGLAMSSRNGRLSSVQREQAGQIYSALKCVVSAFAGGQRKTAELRAIFLDKIASLSGSEVLRCDFLATDLSREFSESEDISNAFLAVAVRYGGVRLIDNIEL